MGKIFTDKELLKEYHLENMQNRFRELLEYSFITKPLVSEEDDEQGQQGQQPPQPQPQGNDAGNGANNMPPQGMDGNQPQQPMADANTASQPPMGTANPQGNQQMPPQPISDQQAPDQNDMPSPTDMDVNGGETEEDGDEVIDVDDLTQAQETSEVKIDGVNDKLQNMLTVMNKFIDAIDKNDKKIDDLKAEFEKRNPSEEEKLNIRSQASSPFSETPKEYWERKGQNSNYNVIFNNEVDPDKEQEEFVIKKSDLNNVDDRTLAKSLDMPSKLSDFLDF